MAKDGGPAFPVMTEYGQYLEGTSTAPGMSLRDYFAAVALTGVQANCLALAQLGGEAHGPEKHAIMAYKLADAMLAEREKP